MKDSAGLGDCVGELESRLAELGDSLGGLGDSSNYAGCGNVG